MFKRGLPSTQRADLVENLADLLVNHLSGLPLIYSLVTTTFKKQSSYAFSTKDTDGLRKT